MTNEVSGFEAFEAASRAKPRFDLVEVYGFPRPVRIRSINAADFARVQDAARGKGAKGLRDAYSFLVALCVVDEDGNRLFSADRDAKMLNSLDSLPAQQLTDACMRHCGLSESDMEEVAKNSTGSSTENTDTESPQLSVG